MFRRTLPVDGDAVTIIVEDTPVRVPAGESVAAAVLGAGFDHTRSSAVSGAPRAPWCMMGACFECLMEIDGEANRQACMIPVRDGMRVRRQHGARGLEQT